MFRIRKIVNDNSTRSREIIEKVQRILRDQFDDLGDDTIRSLPEQLRNPLKYKYLSLLFTAEDINNTILGFALLQYLPDLHFCYLDYLSAANQMTGRGIGGALYERVREIARQYHVKGLFFECLPDIPSLCKDKSKVRQNASRLRFYENYQARPVINTAYQTPVSERDTCPPFLVLDNLGRTTLPSKIEAKAIVKAILERKYGDVCPPAYIELVVRSIKDDPIRLRKPRYRQEQTGQITERIPSRHKIMLVVNDRHQIHHVRDRGYVESPVRIKSILGELSRTNLFKPADLKRFGEKYISAVHAPDFVNYLKRASRNVSSKESIYPYVFPIRNAARPPRELAIRAGYYCIDTFTPINHNAYLAAKRAVDCALTAAESILDGQEIAYALVRPPGHHAEQRAFGGFCYFNAAAICADYLARYSPVAMLDIDYHHGNGQQNIFYHRNDVLTVSIHGHPRFAYPYFSGFREEKGSSDGTGFNANYPLPQSVDGQKYRTVLRQALNKIEKFKPGFLIVALGLDVAKGDPTGTWSLTPKDFHLNGEMIGASGLPLLVIQEGGYKIRSLGINARHFFQGLWKGFYGGPNL